MAMPKSEEEYRALIGEFEAGTLPKSEWRHAEHVAVAFWYLVHFDETDAIDRIRHGIQRLNARHGVPQTPTGGYHETWTIFFAKKLARFIGAELDPGLSLIERLDRAVLFLEDFREITRQHYSTELITSWEARTRWQEPDLKKLEEAES